MKSSASDPALRIASEKIFPSTKQKPLFKLFNLLSPNGDQHQFSPNNIHTLSRDKIVRINK